MRTEVEEGLVQEIKQPKGKEKIEEDNVGTFDILDYLNLKSSDEIKIDFEFIGTEKQTTSIVESSPQLSGHFRRKHRKGVLHYKMSVLNSDMNVVREVLYQLGHGKSIVITKDAVISDQTIIFQEIEEKIAQADERVLNELEWVRFLKNRSNVSSKETASAKQNQNKEQSGQDKEQLEQDKEPEQDTAPAKQEKTRCDLEDAFLMGIFYRYSHQLAYKDALQREENENKKNLFQFLFNLSLKGNEVQKCISIESNAAREGRLLLEREGIIALSFSMKESAHNYIQYLFPNRDPSKAHPEAPLLTYKVRNYLLTKEGKQILLENFTALLEFYGLKLIYKSENPVVELQANFLLRSAEWLTENNHNFLRISRMLICLRSCGLQAEAIAFFKLLARLKLDPQYGIPLSGETFQHWQRAVGLQKNEMLQYDIIQSEKGKQTDAAVVKMVEKLNKSKSEKGYGAIKKKDKLKAASSRMLQGSAENSYLHRLISTQNQKIAIYKEGIVGLVRKKNLIFLSTKEFNEESKTREVLRPGMFVVVGRANEQKEVYQVNGRRRLELCTIQLDESFSVIDPRSLGQFQEQIKAINKVISAWQKQSSTEITGRDVQSFQEKVKTIYDGEKITATEAQDIQLIRADKGQALRELFGLLRAFRQAGSNGSIFQPHSLLSPIKRSHYSLQRGVIILIKAHKLTKLQIENLKSFNDEEINNALEEHYPKILEQGNTGAATLQETDRNEREPASLQDEITQILKNLQATHDHYSNKASYDDLERDLSHKICYTASIGETYQVFDAKGNLFPGERLLTHVAIMLHFPNLSSNASSNLASYTNGQQMFTRRGSIKYKKDIKRVLEQGILLANQYGQDNGDRSIGIDCGIPEVSGLTPQDQALAYRLFAQATLELARDMKFVNLENFVGLSIHATPEVAKVIRRIKREYSGPFSFNFIIADERANTITPQRALDENHEDGVSMAVSLTDDSTHQPEGDYVLMSAGLASATFASKYNPHLLDTEKFVEKNALLKSHLVKVEKLDEEELEEDEVDAQLIAQTKNMIKFLRVKQSQIEDKLDMKISDTHSLTASHRRNLIIQHRNILSALHCFDHLISSCQLFFACANTENAKKLFNECRFDLNLALEVESEGKGKNLKTRTIGELLLKRAPELFLYLETHLKTPSKEDFIDKLAEDDKKNLADKLITKANQEIRIKEDDTEADAGITQADGPEYRALANLVQLGIFNSKTEYSKRADLGKIVKVKLNMEKEKIVFKKQARELINYIDKVQEQFSKSIFQKLFRRGLWSQLSFSSLDPICQQHIIQYAEQLLAVCKAEQGSNEPPSDIKGWFISRYETLDLQQQKLIQILLKDIANLSTLKQQLLSSDDKESFNVVSESEESSKLAKVTLQQAYPRIISENEIFRENRPTDSPVQMTT